MKINITSFLFLCLWCSVKAKCVMRDFCYVRDGFYQTCPYSGEALPYDHGLTPEDAKEAFSIIERRCPHLLYDESGDRKPDDQVLTCCALGQLREMDAGFLLSDSILGRCPTCAKNFNRHVCELNCATDQDRFVEVFTNVTRDGIEFVSEINYRMYEDFMINAHASCAGVLVPQTGMPAINLMCGSAPVCDADAWFKFVGDTQANPLAPTQVNVYRWPTPEDSMNARAPPCNETEEGDVPCSCIDCIATCPIGNEPIQPEVCTVFANVNCISFSVSLVFFVLTVIVFLILTSLDWKRSKPNQSKSNETSDTNKITKNFQLLFSYIGVHAAKNPQLMIMLTSWIAFSMVFGLTNLQITSNPVEIWSAPDSRSRAELNYFNSRFGPFYRAAQVFLQVKGLESFTRDNITFGPAYRIEALKELVALEDAIINIGRDDGGVTLEQVCYAPIRSPGAEKLLDECVIMSASSYLGANRNNINNNTYLNNIRNCLNNHLNFGCLASWGGGSEPEITFGGYDEDILKADTLLINFPISNYLGQQDLQPVLEWEQKFIDLLHDYEANWKSDFIDVSFGTERSIEDEIKRISFAEAIPMAISYVLMFIYVMISLGNVRSLSTCFVDSKISVAIGSITIVALSIFCAIGTMGYAGITVTLLAVNVIPFFMLSIGIDNVFLMVNCLHDINSKLKDFEDFNENLSFNKRRNFVFKKMMERVGPSIFVSSITQITCFAIGTLANFPAVVTFAMFATISIAYLFIFQITAVVALLSLDYKRASQNRIDIFCCVQKKVLNDDDPLNTSAQGVISKLMVPYSKFLMKRQVKITVVILFAALLCLSVTVIPQVEVGLDQEMALPKDSYVYKYLRSVNDLMIIGPPVYFVLKGGLNFTDPNHQNVICGGGFCYEDSLNTQIFLAAQFSNITFIARSSNSWIDDFFDWSNAFEACCKYNTTDGSFCASTDDSPECAYCVIERGEWQNGLRLSSEAFERYIPFFLRDAPTEMCNKGGLASYFGSVNYILDSEGSAHVQDSNFMAYHSSLGSSKDYITAVKYGYEISENITKAIQKHTGKDVEVFPYSVFYVFYEQYLYMWQDTFSSIGLSLLGALLINLIVSGFNFVTSFAVMFTALMVVLDMMGVMYIWNIPLNAVSCVNLIVSIGIAVEFCSHIAYALSISKAPREERVADALKSVGATIVTGITLTNLPVVVLAFAYTEIIEVFFFRMFLSLVILGFLHGMIFFPVLLSYLNMLTSKSKSN